MSTWLFAVAISTEKYKYKKWWCMQLLPFSEKFACVCVCVCVSRRMSQTTVRDLSLSHSHHPGTHLNQQQPCLVSWSLKAKQTHIVHTNTFQLRKGHWFWSLTSVHPSFIASGTCAHTQIHKHTFTTFTDTHTHKWSDVYLFNGQIHLATH